MEQWHNHRIAKLLKQDIKANKRSLKLKRKTNFFKQTNRAKVQQQLYYYQINSSIQSLIFIKFTKFN